MWKNLFPIAIFIYISLYIKYSIWGIAFGYKSNQALAHEVLFMIVFYYTWITRGIVSMFIMIFSFIKNLNFFMIPPQLISELIDNYEELNIILIQQSSVWYILLIVYTYLSFKLSFLWPLPLHFDGTWQYDTTSLVDIFSVLLKVHIFWFYYRISPEYYFLYLTW